MPYLPRCAEGPQLPSAGVLSSARMRPSLSIRCFQKALWLFGVRFASSTCSCKKVGDEFKSWAPFKLNREKLIQRETHAIPREVSLTGEMTEAACGLQSKA